MIGVSLVKKKQKHKKVRFPKGNRFWDLASADLTCKFAESETSPACLHSDVATLLGLWDVKCKV